MAYIMETPHFLVDTQDRPFLPRCDGGHVRIKIKDASIEDRTQLTPKMAIEYMWISMIVGEALQIALNNRGIPVVKINYQDMGNWPFKEGKRPSLHYHVFARAENATKQPFPESMYLPDRSSGFYEGFEPLNEDDIVEIREQIERISHLEKYEKSAWGL